MRKVYGSLIVSVLAFCLVVPISSVSAKTISITQTITITATVAPARSIVINDKGEMIKIYSNTTENVTPRVYLNDVPGEARPLTPGLLKQYKQVMSQQKNVVGVAIPVEPPVADGDSVRSVLMKTISSLTRPLSL